MLQTLLTLAPPNGITPWLQPDAGDIPAPTASAWNAEQPPMGLFKTETGLLFMADIMDRRQEDFSVHFANSLFTVIEIPPKDIWEGDWKFSDYDGDRKGFRKSYHIAMPIRETGIHIRFQDGFLIVWLPFDMEALS